MNSYDHLAWDNARLRRVIDDLIVSSQDEYGCISSQQAFDAVSRLYNSLTQEDYARIAKLYMGEL